MQRKKMKMNRRGRRILFMCAFMCVRACVCMYGCIRRVCKYVSCPAFAEILAVSMQTSNLPGLYILTHSFKMASYTHSAA